MLKSHIALHFNESQHYKENNSRMAFYSAGTHQISTFLVYLVNSKALPVWYVCLLTVLLYSTRLDMK